MAKRLHVEGGDACKLMDEVDGMGSLVIRNDHNQVVNCGSWPVLKDIIRHAGDGKILSAEYVISINLHPLCYRIEKEIVGWEWPREESLYCSMYGAMQGGGWSGHESSENGITVAAFIQTLWRFTRENGWDIKYIEEA